MALLMWRDEILGGNTEALTRQLEDMVAQQNAPFNWTSVPYSASNFSGTGGMSWTVASGDVTTYAYVRLNRVLRIAVAINNTTVGGTLSTGLTVRLPLGLTAQRTMGVPANINNNGTWSIGHLSVTAGSPFLFFFILGFATNWTASTRNSGVSGQIEIEAA